MSLPQQLLGLRRDFPDGIGELKRGRLNWAAVLQPTPISRDYLVRLDYRDGDTPRIFEDWLHCHEWRGGGEHPGIRRGSRMKDSKRWLPEPFLPGPSLM